MKIVDTEFVVILPNLGKRFSGVTSTLLQVLSYQMKSISLCVVGKKFMPETTPIASIWGLLRLTKQPLKDGRFRVFHSRRNIEMLLGVVLRDVFRRKVKLIFTSTAQRKHSKYTRFLMNRMDSIITTSDRAGSFLLKTADHIVPHGIDVAKYPFVANKAMAWKKLGIEGKKGIGIFGRVRPQKGIDLFVDAMIRSLPHYPEFTAVIVGKVTPSFEKFVRIQKDKIKEAGLVNRFVWLGEVEYKQLPALYGAMSIVASVSRVEGFGLTCLEAMSAGAPVIASRTGGFELVVRDGVDGLLVPCDSDVAIEEAFCEMNRTPDRLAEMSLSARERIVESFTVEREARRLLAIYEELSHA